MSNWLTYSPVSGHGNATITLSASTLTGLEDRVATLIATGSQEGQTLSATTVVTQKYLTLTEIYFENLTWSTDVACSGGTATKDNCSFSIIAKYSDNSTEDITNKATISGSLVVPLTTATTRQSVGTLTLTATYEDKTCTGSVEVYQEATSLSEIFFNNLEWATDIPASGGTATKNNCNYSVYAKYSNNTQIDITSEAEVTGSLVVEYSTIEERHSAGTLMLTAKYENLTCNGSVTAYQEAYYRDYLKFTFVSDGTWTYTDSSEVNGIEYSINNGKWTLINSKELSVLSGDTIRVRGRNRVYNGRKFGGTAYFNLSGNIMALIGGVNYENLNKLNNEIYNRAFQQIFANSNVVEASELLLPATALTDYCYSYMFQNCKSLTSAPALPATTLAINCYSSMFSNCASLTTAPELPATTLAEDCYAGMFGGCTSLTTAPALPATTLAERCYYAMFSGCKSLTTAPELPVTKLEYYCYSYMFDGCTSLTSAPALPATTLASSCYSGMFRGCTSLTTAPELPAPFLAIGCYNNMFQNCSSLNYIKCLSEPINAYYAENWVQGVASTGTFVKNPKMVSWGTGDSGIPSGWTVVNDGILLTGITISDLVWETNVPASGGTATKDNCSYRIIANYSGGTTSEVTSEAIVNGSQIVESSQITSAHTAGTLTLTATYSGYSAEASVTIMQDGYNPPTPPSPTGSSEYLTFTILSAGTINWRASNTSITRTIEYKLNNGEWTSITSNTGSSAPTITVNSGDKLQFRGNNTEYNTSASDYNSFSGSTAYFNLSGNILSLFYGDNFDAQTAPTIFELNDMFQSTNVIDAGGLVLPNIVRRFGYFEMFCFCTKLTKAPVLPATTLEFKCYSAMFYGCTSLNYIKCLATDISEKDCTENWLYGVAPTGTFVKNPKMTSWTTGDSGIPEGWTVENNS